MTVRTPDRTKSLACLVVLGSALLGIPAMASEPDNTKPLEFSLEPKPETYGDWDRPFMLGDAPKQPKSYDDYRDRWRYRSYMEFWAAGIEGDVGTRDRETEVDKSFDDLMDKLDIGLGLHFEVGNGPWTFVFHGLYYSFEDDAQTRNGFDADAEASLIVINAGAYYLLLDKPLGAGDGQHLYFEVGGGVRWTRLDAEIDINEGPFAGFSGDAEDDWFDPFVAARVRFDLNEDFNLSLGGTAGGFGVGSDFTWTLRGQLEYRFNQKISIIGGYQALDYDYDEDNLVWDVTMHGPFIGLSFRL